MTIGIITTHSEPDADKRLLEAAKQQNQDIMLLDLMQFSLAVSQNSNPHIYYDGQPIEDELQVIIPRIDCPHTPFGFSVLRQFHALGIPSTDSATAISCGRDKLHSLQYLMECNIPIPSTGFAYTREQLKCAIDSIGSFPIVMKVLDGTEGNGVYLAHDHDQAKVIFDRHNMCGTRIIVQEFIKESAGTDMRSFVVGGRIVANMCRKSQNGDFRANIALGGCSTDIKLTSEEEALVLKACAAIGMRIAGVDFIRSERGPLILEINTSPGFTGKEGIESVTHTDIAGLIIADAIALALGEGMQTGRAANYRANRPLIDEISTNRRLLEAAI